MSPVDQAAGVVLFIEEPAAGRTYLVLESARHGTWGFPKGHRDEGETIEECAQREVAEETGELPWTAIEGFYEISRYVVPQGPKAGRTKEVHYFLGRALEKRSLDSAAAGLSDEHVHGAWLPLDEALERLQHEENRRVLRSADAFLEQAGRA